MHVFISAGEPSGDLHGANLVRALKAAQPGVRVHGFGGPKMATAGCTIEYPLPTLAVMGLWLVLVNLLKFRRLLKQAETYFRTQKPDCVVVIDFPGFHWQLAKRAHALGIPVYYFVPPQLWAWHGSRVKKMKRYCERTFSALPFEHDWFEQHGMPSTYVGHPFFDELEKQRLDPLFLEAQRSRPEIRIGILPGSRGQEVEKNLAGMLRAADRIYAHHPGVRFLIAAFNEEHAVRARALADQYPTVPIEVYVGRTPEIIQLSTACISVSGSVSLELMYAGTPAVMVYRVSRLLCLVGRLLIHIPYMTLVNLLANKELYPEFPGSEVPEEAIAGVILHWLDNPSDRMALRKELINLRDRYAQPGACATTASELVHLHGMPQQRMVA